LLKTPAVNEQNHWRKEEQEEQDLKKDRHKSINTHLMLDKS